MKKANVNVDIIFKNRTKKQMEHLDKAEMELLKAGMRFDTNYNFPTKTRTWFLDSVKGVRVVQSNSQELPKGDK